MVLDSENIQYLNRYMLGLGQPVERDYQGYNRPDWMRMEGIGRYMGDLDDRTCMYILETLSNYVNTQLTSDKEDILESLNEYKERVKERESESADDFLYDKDKDMFIPDDVKYEGKSYSTRNGMSNVPFIRVSCPIGKQSAWNVALGMKQRYSVLVTYAQPHEKRVVLDIRPDVLENALKRIDNEAKYGCKPDKEFEAFLKDGYEAVMEEYREACKPVVVSKPVEILSVDDEGILIHFDGYVGAVNDLKSSYLIKSKPDNGKWNTWVPKNAVDAVADALNRNGYVAYDPKEARGMIEDKIREKEERFSNKSDNTLIDLDKVRLPFKPFDFQIEDAKKLVEHNALILGSEMGVGKTFQAVLVGASIPGQKLVVVPESLRLNWKREIQNVLPDVDISVCKPGTPFRIAKDWTIVGYRDAVKFKDVLAANKFECMFVDEAHKCKSVNNKGEAVANRGAAVIDICDSVKHVYPMTGTPIPNYNKDVYNLFRMIKAPEVITGDKYDFIHFAQEYCDAVKGRFGWECNGSSNEEELNELLNKYMVRRLKCDVLPNLTKQRVFIPVELTSKKYFSLERRLTYPKKGDSFLNIAIEARNAMACEKIKSGIDMADSLLEANKQVVIVSYFNDALDAVKDYYKDDCCCIRGSMTDEQKQKAIDDFQAGNVHVCALNTVAGGVGVTLTKASDMIICDYDWTPANLSQVEDRICRTGQKEHCMVHYVYGDNSEIDSLFMELISNRSANIDNVVDRKENTMDFWANRGEEMSPASFIELLKQRMEKKREELDKQENNTEQAQVGASVVSDDIEI